MKMEKPPVEVSGVCAERGSDHIIGSHFSSAGAKTSSLSSAAETDESLTVAL